MSFKPFQVAVHYFIQNDPCECIKEPNMFFLPNDYNNLNEVKAEHVYSNFPLSSYYTYYLRFFISDPLQKIKGWFDCPSKASIPVYNNIAYVKALRIPKGAQIQFKANCYYDREAAQEKKAKSTLDNHNEDLLVMNDYQILEFNGNNREFVSKTIDNSTPIKSCREEKSFEEAGDSKAREEKTRPQWKDRREINMKRRESRDDSDLFNLYLLKKDKENIYYKKRKESRDDMDLLNSLKEKNKTITLEDCDVFDLFPKGKQEKYNPPDSEFQYFPQTGDYSASSTPYEAQMPNNYDSTLEGIFSGTKPNDKPSTSTFTSQSQFPIDNISLSLSTDDLHSQIDLILSKWSLCGASDKKNLICLLSSLYEVWTTNSTFWSSISTEELINNKNKVRTVYKQAMLQLHCDKNTDKDEKTRYIAKSLYQIINEAYINYNKYT